MGKDKTKMLAKPLLLTALAMGVSCMMLTDSDGYLAAYGEDDHHEEVVYEESDHHSDDDHHYDDDHHSDDSHHSDYYGYRYAPSEGYLHDYDHHGHHYGRPRYYKRRYYDHHSSHSDGSSDYSDAEHYERHRESDDYTHDSYCSSSVYTTEHSSSDGSHHHYVDSDSDSSCHHRRYRHGYYYPRKHHYRYPKVPGGFGTEYKYGPSANYVYAHYGSGHNEHDHHKSDHDTESHHSHYSHSSETIEAEAPVIIDPSTPAPEYEVPDLFGWDPHPNTIVHTDDEDADDHHDDYGYGHHGYGHYGYGYPGYYLADNHRGVDPWYRNVGHTGGANGYGPNQAYGGYYGYKSPQEGAKSYYERFYYSPKYLEDVYD